MEEKKVIKFSHHYPKLKGQTSGKLIGIEELIVENTDEFHKLLDYDTVYMNADIEERYPIEFGTKYMQLIFVGNYHIPFCTLRLMKNPTRVQYYFDSIGKEFDFEFLDET